MTDNREERKAHKLNEAERDKKRARAARKHKMNGKLQVIRVFCMLLIAGLIGRIGYIIIVHGDEYTKRVEENQENRLESRSVNPNRGSIVDRNGGTLAISNIVYRVMLDVRLIVSEDEKDIKSGKAETTSQRTFAALAPLIGLSETQLREFTAKNPDGSLVYDTHWKLIGIVPYTEAAKIKENSAIKAVFLREESERSYVYGYFAPQVIGFLRGDSLLGLERQYNTYLTGSPGKLFTNTSIGSSASSVDPVDGYTVVTTFDFTIQQIAQDAANDMLRDFAAQNTSVIVMNPQTGEVLAMAEAPYFNLNDPTDVSLTNSIGLINSWAGLDNAERMNSLNRIWNNYNITNTFEPGSTFKPIVIAAALEEGIITENSPASYFCGGGKTFSNWDDPIPCHLSWGHGHQTLTEVLANSCNVAMMDIAEMLGRDLFYKYQTGFGYGERTGIDLPAEESAANLIYSLYGLGNLELATHSFGQSFNCTPIQVMNSFAALVNGGDLMRPYVVSRVTDKYGNIVYENKPEIVRKIISKETSDYMRTAMVSVVTPQGTGRRAVIEGYNIGGKTGTAQQEVTRDKYIVSFIAYLPAENPEIIAMTLIDRPAEYVEGSTSAAPALKEVLEKIIEYKGILPIDIENPTPVRSLATNKLDDYTGLSVSDTIALFNKQGIQYKLMDTSGDIVTKQFPTAGSDIDSESVVLLYIASSGDIPLVVVPDVVDMPITQAYYVIEQCGFIPVVEGLAMDWDEYVKAITYFNNDTDDMESPLTGQPRVVSQKPVGASLPRSTQIVIST